MIEEEILEGNKLIAKFLGWEEKSYPTHMRSPFHGQSIWWVGNTTKTFGCIVGEEYFHDSWEWLMSVIQKIEELGYFVMINKWTSVYTGSEGEKISITSVEGNTKILNTWKACISFIEWYNKQK